MEIICSVVYYKDYISKNNNMLIKRLRRDFDKFEYNVRLKLSNYPILYAFIGGVGIVLFWRGVWHIADDINLGSVVSLIIGAVVLIGTGVFVAEFIGNRLIISGLVGEKKLEEKAEGKIETEETQIKNLQSTLARLEKKLDHIDQEVEKK
ncbi:MAG TPA: hypothetical protein VGO63_03210 [Candidatus Paceibacterota bacterium]|jgi:hypothetical protein|nr:hypothetical protein [Candidatus Paceibacterota bacterium]